ncbi:MAG: ASCH domain-containing protein [Bacteroidales bacterium]|jgi:hypothetical protein|nr:ASCH domain-containing protein [Bacteroidales bacterium]
MKILTLIIKQKYFDAIVAGTKKVETREVRAKTASRYIEYVDTDDTVYARDTDIPADRLDYVQARPIKYDAIRLYVGYQKDRQTALVGVKGAKIIFLTDEKGNEVTYTYEGREYVDAEIDYQLGSIIKS